MTKNRHISEETLDQVAAAIERARCPDREGPYGLYDYSTHTGGQEPHAIRDFRDPESANWGKIIASFASADEARAAFDTLTRRHIAWAAIRRYQACLELERGTS